MQEYVSRTDTKGVPGYHEGAHAPLTSSQLKEENKGARAPSLEQDQWPIEGKKKGACAPLTSGQCLLKY